MIAGKIIASVPTSTSSIVGYICLQIINLLYTHDTENVVKNAFFNLGLNVMDLIPQEQIEQKKAGLRNGISLCSVMRHHPKELFLMGETRKHWIEYNLICVDIPLKFID